MEQLENRIPEEQSLVQLRITGFLNPAPHGKGWPSMGNLTAKMEGPAATRNSSRGSPSGGGGGSDISG